jgi:hypothetical protein
MKLIKCLKPILLYFLFVPLLVSCGSNEETDGKIVRIDVDSAQKGKISDHFQSLEYILLDYPDSLPIVNLAKMIVTDDKILVESRETAAVFVFDRKGNLLNVIRNYGEGPGQFVLIDDIFLEGDLIRIHNHYLKKYLIYNFEGSLVEEGKLEEVGDRSFVGKDFSLFQFQKGYDQEKNTIIRKSNDNEVHGFLPLREGFENFYKFNNIQGIQYDPFRNSFYITDLNSYEIPILDGDGFLKGKLDFDFGKNNFELNKRISMAEKPYEVNTLVKDNRIVRNIHSFFPFKNKILVNFFEGIRTSHFLFLDDDFEIIYHVNELENDFDGMKVYLRSWAYSENEVIYQMESRQFFNDYVETFNEKAVTVKKGDVHDFFRVNKEKLKDEKYVLVLLKVKE